MFIPYILVSYQVQAQELWEVAQANHFQRKASVTLLDQTLKAPTTWQREVAAKHKVHEPNALTSEFSSQYLVKEIKVRWI